MIFHHHRPSMTLTRVRQLRSYWSRSDSQTQKSEATKIKVEKKLRFDLNNNERKDLLIPVSSSVQASALFLHETLLSS